MAEHSFDSLSKEMADSTISRGRALKLVGAAIVGGAVAGLFPGTAEARRQRRTVVTCDIGAFNDLNDCNNSAGKRFSCSANSVSEGRPATCRSRGTRYRCTITDTRPGGATLFCKRKRD